MSNVTGMAIDRGGQPGGQGSTDTPGDRDAAVALVDVAKEYASRHGDVQAVERVDLTIASGEFFSLLGPSGCGKTTTLRMIAGFEEPTRGEILLYGTDVVGVPPNKRDVNLVFQNYALFPHLSVYENVAFGLRRKKVPKNEVAQRVEQMLALVELHGKEERRPRELSGGQQQRVALARALVNRPKVLLLDEPLGALDLKLRQSMQLELKRIQREVGITFVYVTHDQGEALTMSDRIAVMNLGRVEQLGAPREIYEHPATTFVAGFIGTSNIIRANVERVVGGHAVMATGPDEQVLVPTRFPVSPSEPVAFTVRPEKITLSTVPGDGDAARLRGRVREIVYLGTSTNYLVTTSNGAEVAVFLQNSGSAEDAAAVGQEVWLSWRPVHSLMLADSPSAVDEAQQ
ncbi:MAG: ABC transporter ATP-binding protein [Actinomycetes bacterium]